ncbi:MAG: histidine--tRNA ligase [Neisseriaceae bacterium]|nr:histidine--tRNA ligase [Neisseriaceae bacterium]
MSVKVQAIKGMNDLLPSDSAFWQRFEAEVNEWTASYGVSLIRTPVVESTQLFVRSIGENTDIVDKEMYTFVDALNGDSLTLRPEGTASCLRAVVEHNLLYNGPQRLWYMGPMFRHERPQKGRYRQFHQIGVECLGFDGPDVDAELIGMAYDLWCRLGLQEYLTLEINTLGNRAERALHREALIKHLEAHEAILDEDAKKRLYSNPLRVLDTKNPDLQAMANAAPKLIDYLGADSLQHYADYKAMITALGIPYVENPRLVRGLDYYNLSVFEWVTTKLGSQGTVCGGGRYDGLIEELGGKPAPSVGFAIGVERLILLAQEFGTLEVAAAPDVYLLQQGEGAAVAGLVLAKTLRQAGFKVLQHGGTASFKSQMKKADGSGAHYAVILGENELNTATVSIKDLRGDKAQITVAQADLVKQLTEWME